MLVSVKDYPQLPSHVLLPQGRAEMSIWGWSPRVAGVPLDVSPWVHMAAWRPQLLKTGLLHVMLEEESLHLTDESTEVLGGDVTSGYDTNETAEWGRSSALALVHTFSLSVRVTPTPLEHPCARPFAFHHCNPLRNVPEPQRVNVS